MNEKKDQSQEPASKTTDGAEGTKPSAWKRLVAKRWVFPATYVAAAAIILTLMWVYQGTDDRSLSSDTSGLTETQDEAVEQDGDAVTVTAPAEMLEWPVANRDEFETSMPFYDSKASDEDRQAALVQYGDTFTPHMGIDLSREDNATFDVLAAQKGEVTRAEKHPVVGYAIEVAHEGGLVTIYQSLAEMSVEKGDDVKQGEVIGKAGRDDLEKELGVHLHFEVQANGVPVNPQSLINAQ